MNTKLLLALASTLLAPTVNFAKGVTTFNIKATKQYPEHISFSHIKVIDLRLTGDTIGILPENFTTKSIVLSQSFCTFFQAFGNDIFAHKSDSAKDTLIIAVKDFDIRNLNSERLNLGTLYVNMAFYKGGNNRYSKVSEVDSLFEMFYKKKDHFEQGVSEVLTSIMWDIPGKLPEKESITDLNSISNRHLDNYPALSRNFKTGVYYTYEQFRENTPAATEFIYKKYLHNGERLYKFYTKITGKKLGTDLSDTMLFAICYNDRWFKKTGEDFWEMKFENGDFYYYDYCKGFALINNQYIASIGYSYGIIGSIIGSAAQIVVNNIQKKIPIQLADGLYLMRLDPITGTGKRTKRLE